MLRYDSHSSAKLQEEEQMLRQLTLITKNYDCYILQMHKQDNNHTNFERPPFNSVHQKAKVFVKSQNASVISLKYVQKWQIVVHSLSTSLSQQSCTVST